MKEKLTDSDYENAASILGVDVNLIKAVAEVESSGDGFLSNGLPKILFERHHFHRLTRGKFTVKDNYDVSYPKSGGYTSGGEWVRFKKALTLDSSAAMKSTSWGKFQIMGFNFSQCGFSSVEEFVKSMYISEREHLNAFVQFMINNKLHIHLQNRDYTAFAVGYNGPAQKGYDSKIKSAFIELNRSNPASNKKDVDIKTIQSLLIKAGYIPGKVDGIYGERTKSAIVRFQQVNGLPVTGIPSEELMLSLSNAKH